MFDFEKPGRRERAAGPDASATWPEAANDAADRAPGALDNPFGLDLDDGPEDGADGFADIEDSPAIALDGDDDLEISDDDDADDDALAPRGDWDASVFGPAEIELSEPKRPAAAQARKAAAINTFSWVGFAGGLLALAWVSAAAAAPVALYGMEALAALNPAAQMGLIALAIGPAAMLWLAASAAGESAKAGRLAAEMVRLSQAHAANATQRPFAFEHPRADLSSYDTAVDGALRRLSDLNAAASAQARAFSQAIAATGGDADALIARLSEERNAFAALNGDMRAQAETLAHSVNRQVRLMREASKLVKTEIVNAEDVFEAHLAAFKTTATVVADRTQAMEGAASAAANANQHLEGALGESLHILSEATRLTDAARQSTDEAARAAQQTASSVQETTQRAIFEAKRAATLIRKETQALERVAAETLDTLRNAADAARAASEDAQAAADRHAGAIGKRLAALSETATLARATAPRPAAPRVSEFAYAARAPQRPDPVGFDALATTDADEQLICDAFDMIAQAGVRLGGAFAPADLNRIARKSREGAAARRRAVCDAAPGAVQRIAAHMRYDREAARIGAAFRARPDLAKRERGEDTDVLSAFLLIDAATA
ncbi:MAG: hypothetical protein GC189_10190 [Alphaproteobacteria bacterium]|nr:hypothetical protein [Alphaproteobacteria bacterium]